MKMIYTNAVDNEIYMHEERMLLEYTRLIQRYTICFEKYGYALKTGLVWKNSLKKRHPELKRGIFQNGYECYVYCVVQENDKDIFIESSDGEADYYDLSTTWLITSMRRSFWNIQVSLYTELEDIDKELSCLLKELKGKGRV